MKRLNVIYNHNIFDQPYKQSEVRKTEKLLKSRFGEDLEVFCTHTNLSGPNDFIPDSELIIAEHTFELTSEDKTAMAAILNNSVTKIKSATPIDVLISFRKIADDDLYFFPQGK